MTEATQTRNFGFKRSAKSRKKPTALQVSGRKPEAQKTLLSGRIARLDRATGLGYVERGSDRHVFVFVVGQNVRRATALSLSEGSAVRFRLTDDGKISELVAG